MSLSFRQGACPDAVGSSQARKEVVGFARPRTFLLLLIFPAINNVRKVLLRDGASCLLTRFPLDYFDVRCSRIIPYTAIDEVTHPSFNCTVSVSHVSPILPAEYNVSHRNI